jgi:hypothetical protein
MNEECNRNRHYDYNKAFDFFAKRNCFKTEKGDEETAISLKQ